MWCQEADTLIIQTSGASRRVVSAQSKAPDPAPKTEMDAASGADGGVTVEHVLSQFKYEVK